MWGTLMKNDNTIDEKRREKHSFLKMLLIKRKSENEKKSEVIHMKNIASCNKECIQHLENRVTSLENKSLEMEKIDNLVEVQKDITGVLTECAENLNRMGSKRRRSILEIFANTAQIILGICTVVLGFFTWQIYSEQLEITKIQNEPIFSCSYNAEKNELWINKSNGKVHDIYIDIESVYISSVIDISDNHFLFNGLPFSVNTTPIITVEQVGYEEYSVDLSNTNTKNIEFSQKFLNHFKDTKYGCQIDIAYVIEVSYRNDYEKDTIEHKFFILKTGNRVFENTNGVIIIYDDATNNAYNPAEFKTDQVIQIDENADCVFAVSDMRYDWNVDKIEVNDGANEDIRMDAVEEIVRDLTSFYYGNKKSSIFNAFIGEV